MRRPLKPFVTEYKPSTRRQPAATRHAQPFAAEVVAPAEAGRFDPAWRTDDSYEAALRAADALFSPQKDKPQPSLPAHVGGDVTEASASQDLAGRGGGRILRVLDEPSPEPTSELFNEIERERAPKRRGRKPGSKNRPKTDRISAPLVAADAPSPDSPARNGAPATGMSDPARSAPAVDAEPVEHPMPASGAPVAQDLAGQDRDSASQALANQDLANQDLGNQDLANQDSVTRDGQGHVGDDAGGEEATGSVVAIRSRERRRFSWVRTKLPPGQEWKRRLPKVCW